ncbi:MAG: histidine kinase dimerization/phospho-acceptor domain-containing protein [Erysipelotrichaceae bacterium]
MKRITTWVKQLSLSQQLFALIFFFIAFFASFFFLYLSRNVESFIRDQMYDIIARTQRSVEYYYIEGYPLDNLISEDPDIRNFFFTSDYIPFAGDAFPSEELKKDIVHNLRNLPDESGMFVFQKANHYTYYMAHRLPDDILVVTMIDDQSRIDFRNGLLNSIINTIVLVVGGFFIVLMIWMGYLIHPLNQIRSYIEKVKNGEDPVLKINRDDEIGELASALTDMREELKAQEKVKEDMVHNISHDLKTPIATIKSYAESIKDGIYPYETLEKSVDVIIDNAERLEKKVHSLLYLNRVEYLIKNESRKESTNMKHVIEQVLISVKGIRPEIHFESELDNISFPGLEEPWRVSIENIIDNALRYARSTIKVTLNAQELTIENDGPSISEDRLKAMFKPYEKGTGGQFGLGLSIVSRVVSANDYRVEAGNTKDGVIFRIYPKKQG